MHASSQLRQWFLEWLDGDNRDVHDEVVAKLKELRSCTDELPAAYCQHGMLHLPFGVSYGVAAQKILSKNSEDQHDLVRLATAANPFQAHIWQNALQGEGISCQVLGDYLDAGIGDVPGMTAEVWVEPADAARAEAILRQHQLNSRQDQEATRD
jgi:Putative prokaryotic signal transducing protein